MSFSLVHHCRSPLALQLSRPGTTVPNLCLPVTCRPRSSRLPYSRNWHHGNAQRPTPRGQRHWRPRLTDKHTHSHAQAPRLPCSFTAAAQRGTVQLPDEGMERERATEESGAVIDRHQNLCSTSSSITLLSPYKLHSSLHKHFEIVLTDDHICFVSVLLFLFLPMTHRRVYFLYEYIFYSRFCFFMRRTLEDWGLL